MIRKMKKRKKRIKIIKNNLIKYFILKRNDHIFVNMMMFNFYFNFL